jgi:haloalkane dehalogenase
MTKPTPWLDPTLYPFTPRRFDTEDGALSYLDEGRGPAIVLVHGTPSWSFEWRGVIARLSGSFRCIAVDHLGFGLSAKPPGAPLAPADHARRLRALVTHLGADPRVARIDRVVRSWLGRFLYRWLNFSPRVLLPSAMGPRTKLTRAVHRHYLAPFGARRDRQGPYALACALAGADPYYATLWEKRERLSSVPTSIVWGMKDPALDPALLDRFVTALPHATVTRLGDVGHFPAEEHPEAVVRAIQELCAPARPTTVSQEAR